MLHLLLMLQFGLSHCVRSYVTGKDVNPAIKEMEAMILECASLDREINHFVDVVQQVTAEVRATWHDLITSGKS